MNVCYIFLFNIYGEFFINNLKITYSKATDNQLRNEETFLYITANENDKVFTSDNQTNSYWTFIQTEDERFIKILNEAFGKYLASDMNDNVFLTNFDEKNSTGNKTFHVEWRYQGNRLVNRLNGNFLTSSLSGTVVQTRDATGSTFQSWFQNDELF